MPVRGDISEEPEVASESQPVTTSNDCTSTPSSSREPCSPDEWWNLHASLIASLLDTNLSYNHVVKVEERSRWVAAIRSEMNSLLQNRAWVLAPSTDARDAFNS